MHFSVAMMPAMNGFQLLAQVPAPGVYLNLLKIGIVAALFVGWACAFQWVDRDIEVVKTRRERWNFIVLGTGIGGLVFVYR